ncbi:hypothetical protein V8E54_001297 [Elaphomyces granulatus]
MAEPADQRTIAIEILTAILPAIIAHGAELSMLQTETAIEWAKENIYVPTGVRGNRGDSDKGENWVESMLRGPPKGMQDTLRMTPRQFKLLLRWLEKEAGFKCGYVSARVKLAIFLYIVAQNAPWRTIRNHFGVALRTVMKAFYEVLDAITKHLYQAVVRLPPDDEVPKGIQGNPERMPLEARGLLPVEEDVDKLHPPRERDDDATDLRRRDEIAEKLWHSYLKNQAVDLSDTTER